MKYSIVGIATEDADPAFYPNSRSAEFPELVSQVDDEYDIFIVSEDGRTWYARDFFYMTDLKEFEAIN